MLTGSTHGTATSSSAANTGATDSDAGGSGDEPSAGASTQAQSLMLMIGARFTTAVRSRDGRTLAPRIINHGPVLLAAAQAEAARANGAAAARVIRAAAMQVAERARLEAPRGERSTVLGAAGIARSVITLGSGGRLKATVPQVHSACDRLAAAWVDGKQGRHSEGWIEPMMIGAAVLGAILDCLGVNEIQAEEEASGPARLEVG